MTQEPWNMQIRLARNRMGKTQEEFAALFDTDDNTTDNGTVSRWERGTHLPNEKHQQILRELFPEIAFEFPPSSGKLIWNVPYEPNPFFIGRHRELQELHAQLQRGTPTALTQAIRGLGGIGKTQTASE